MAPSRQKRKKNALKNEIINLEKIKHIAENVKESDHLINRGCEHLQEILQEISVFCGIHVKGKMPLKDGEQIRKQLRSEKMVTIQSLLELKNYFLPLLESNVRKDITYSDDALWILRILIDILEDVSNEELNILTMACSLVARAFLYSLTQQSQEDDEFCTKAAKLLFHILKTMYKKVYIRGMVVILKDLLELLLLLRNNLNFFNEQNKKLLYTAHQMCYALYVKLLPDYIKTKHEDIKVMFELRAVSLAVLVFAEWKDNKIVEYAKDFCQRWSKFLFQSCKYKIELDVRTLLELIKSLDARLPSEKSLKKQITQIGWELTCLYYKLMIYSKNHLNFDQNFCCVPSISFIDSLDLLTLKNLSKLIKHMQSKYDCYCRDPATAELSLHFSSSMCQYLEQKELNIFKIFDLLALFEFACEQQSTLCGCFVKCNINILKNFLNSTKFIKTLFNCEGNDRRTILQYLSLLLATTVEQLYKLNFVNICSAYKNEKVYRLDILRDYSSAADLLFKMFHSMKLNHQEDFKTLGNHLFRLSVAFNTDQEYKLALSGFQLVVCFALDVTDKDKIDTSDLKELCGKYNALIQCCTKLEKFKSAYNTSLQLLDILKKLSETSLGVVKQFLQIQVQYYIKLKFLLVESDKKMKPKLLKNCLCDELERLSENEDSFWSVVLEYEYNMFKKQSNKYDIRETLKRLVELRKEIYEKEGDLLKYSLMMLEFSSFPMFNRTDRYHWCQESVGILEEMDNELRDSGDEMEWHVRDLLAVSYFQTSVMLYEEKVANSSTDKSKDIGEIIASCSEECEDDSDDLMGNVHEEDYLDKQFLVSLNKAVELWGEIYQRAQQMNCKEEKCSLFQDGEQASKCLYDAAVLYSLVGQNFNAIQASYLSGSIYQILSTELDSSQYVEKQTLAWTFAASQFLHVENMNKGEGLLEKLKVLRVESSVTQHHIEITEAAYLLTNGKVSQCVEILKKVLGELSPKKTKVAYTLKSDIFHLFSVLKLLPMLKNNVELLNEVKLDEHFPSHSPFPPIAESLKCLRSLYETCILKMGQGDGDLAFSSSWMILDKLILCLTHQAELLKQQGCALEAKAYLKEALLLAKKFHLSFRVVHILQKISSIDILLNNEALFNQSFDATTKILNASVVDCFQDADLYLPEFVTHHSECCCNYCVYPKLQEIHISFYLLYIESKKQFLNVTFDNVRSVQIVDALIENAKKRYIESFSQFTKLMDLEVINGCGNEIDTQSKKLKRKVSKKKKEYRKYDAADENVEEIHYFSKYNVAAKIIKPMVTQGNTNMIKTVEYLILNMEKTKSIHYSQHEFHRLTAQLYCLRSLLYLGEDMVQKHWHQKNCNQITETDEPAVVKKRTKKGCTDDLKKGTKIGKHKTAKSKREASSDRDDTNPKTNGIDFNMSAFIEDLKKALSVLNPYTDALIIRTIYQMISTISGLSNVNLTIASHFLSSARTLHQEIVSSYGKKLQKLKNEAENGLTESKLFITSNILEKYSDPEFVFNDDTIQPLVDEHIPKGWCVCSISQSELNSKKYLVISRVEPFETPAIVHICLSGVDEQTCTSKSVVCDLTAAFNDENEDLISKFESIQQRSLDSMKILGKKSWWDERLRLDEQLQSTIRRLEDEWLQGWKGLLLGNIGDEEEGKKLSKVVENIEKELNVCFGVEANKVLVKALVNGFHHSAKRQIIESLNFLIGEDDADAAFEIFSKHVGQPKSKSTTKSANSEKDKSTVLRRKPVVLVLDKTIQSLPWESVPFLRNQPITRMPSLLLTATHCMNNQELLSNGISTEKTFYILNPRNDLKRTEVMFSDWFKSQGWSGVVGRAPSETEYTQALTDNDIFIYCGHGSGQEYLGWDSMHKVNCRAVSILMGCSSGKLSVRGELEAHGMVQYYLLAGCPTVVANLWDVTDKDIDLFLQSLLNIWMKESTGSNIAECVSKARHACKLAHLIGASPVVYGLPIEIQQ